jgi:hypothetical protein
LAADGYRHEIRWLVRPHRLLGILGRPHRQLASEADKFAGRFPAKFEDEGLKEGKLARAK